MANQFLTLISSTVYTGAVADPFDLGQMPPSLFSSIEIYLFTVASYFEIADLLLIFIARWQQRKEGYRGGRASPTLKKKVELLKNLF